jgi:hypothetical protein
MPPVGTQNVGRMTAVGQLIVQARFRAARNAARHGTGPVMTVTPIT